MTISDSARDRFSSLGLDREAVELLAKSLAQQIIEESQGSNTPLGGMDYDVWSLYNEGMPKCAFSVPDEQLLFTGNFHLDGSDEIVERSRTVTDDDVEAFLNEINGGIGEMPNSAK